MDALIGGLVIGFMVYCAKSWLTNTSLNIIQSWTPWYQWKETLMDSDLFCVIWDVLMGILSAKIFILGGGQMAMAGMATFGLMTVLNVKTRRARRAVKNCCKKTVDGIIAFRKELPI